MPLTLDQLRLEALSLPVGDRRDLADFIWDSFDHDPEHDAQDEMEFSPEYIAELDRRSAEIANGTAAMIPMEEALKHIDEILRRG